MTTRNEFTLDELKNKFGGTIEGDSTVIIRGVGTVQSATGAQIAFVDNPKYQSYIPQSTAGALIVSPNLKIETNKSLLITENPKLLFAKIVDYFHPKFVRESGIHPSAVIGKDVVIGKNVFIGAFCVIEEGVVIEDDVTLEPHCFIGRNAKIGKNSYLSARVTFYHHTQIGEYCHMHSGVVLGSDGFGFANDQGRWIKVPQVGRVIVGDHVEIGANTTVDRGTLEDTIIEDGVIMDNLIHIGHNVRIGKFTAIAACCGIAGSCVIGAYCMIGGNSILNGHIQITDHCYFIPGSQVANSIKKPGVYSSGIPARDRNTWAKNVARFHQLDDMAGKIKALQKQVHAMRAEESPEKAEAKE